jgi:hypothetical protein
VTPSSKGEAVGGGITAGPYGKVRLMWRAIDSDERSVVYRGSKIT